MRIVWMLRFRGCQTKLGFLGNPQSRGRQESFQAMLTLMHQGDVDLSQEGDQADDGAQAGLTSARKPPTLVFSAAAVSVKGHQAVLNEGV
jgi:hypothetical protein